MTLVVVLRYPNFFSFVICTVNVGEKCVVFSMKTFESNFEF